MLNEIEAGQLCDSAVSALHHGTSHLGSVPKLIRRIIDEGAWKRRKVALHGIVELPSLRDLITLPPMRGWGEDPAKVEALLRDDVEVLAMWRSEMTGEPHRHKPDSDNITIKTDGRGTSRSYTVSRLQRERPDLFDEVKAGNLSANAAAIQAGFRKQPSALQQLMRAWTRATSEERETFLASIHP